MASYGQDSAGSGKEPVAEFGERGKEPFGRNSYAAERLAASQEGLSSMELVY
jgi:hypothetical protein